MRRTLHEALKVWCLEFKHFFLNGPAYLHNKTKLTFETILFTTIYTSLVICTIFFYPSYVLIKLNDFSYDRSDLIAT